VQHAKESDAGVKENNTWHNKHPKASKFTTKGLNAYKKAQRNEQVCIVITGE
jgi:uncharacterized phage infection (PIP) family protein YhgE